MNHYLQYWKYRPDYEQIMLDHTPSDQLRKVHPGDIIWIITISEGTGTFVQRQLLNKWA